jgi:hypothetical protein
LDATVEVCGVVGLQINGVRNMDFGNNTARWEVFLVQSIGKIFWALGKIFKA